MNISCTAISFAITQTRRNTQVCEGGDDGSGKGICIGRKETDQRGKKDRKRADMYSIILVMSFCRLSPSRSTQRHKGRCGRRDGTKEKEGERGQNSLTCGGGGGGG